MKKKVLSSFVAIALVLSAVAAGIIGLNVFAADAGGLNANWFPQGLAQNAWSTLETKTLYADMTNVTGDAIVAEANVMNAAGANYTLEFEAQCNALTDGGFTGVMFKAAAPTDAYNNCALLQLNGYGSILYEPSAAGLNSMATADVVNKPLAGWNKVKITIKGKVVSIWVNEHPLVTDYTMANLSSAGFTCFVVSKAAAANNVTFRNVVVTKEDNSTVTYFTKVSPVSSAPASSSISESSEAVSSSSSSVSIPPVEKISDDWTVLPQGTVNDDPNYKSRWTLGDNGVTAVTPLNESKLGMLLTNDATVEYELTCSEPNGNNAFAGIYLRDNSIDNPYDGIIVQSVGGGMRFLERTAQGFAEFGSSKETAFKGTVKVKISLVGKKATVWINGEPLELAYSDLDNTSTGAYIGLIANNCNAVFKNVTVTDAQGVSTKYFEAKSTANNSSAAATSNSSKDNTSIPANANTGDTGIIVLVLVCAAALSTAVVLKKAKLKV